jgi:hypothetical protein
MSDPSDAQPLPSERSDRVLERTALPIAQSGLPAVSAFFESLTLESLTRLGSIYAAQARFKDPFNEVQGIVAIRAIFESMFRDLQSPRFIVTAATGDARRGCLLWDFYFQTPRISQGAPQCIRGATWLEFDAAGKVILHRDYWDAAEELYEKLPVVGWFMRRLKARLAHPVADAGPSAG